MNMGHSHCRRSVNVTVFLARLDTSRIWIIRPMPREFSSAAQMRGKLSHVMNVAALQSPNKDDIQNDWLSGGFQTGVDGRYASVACRSRFLAPGFRSRREV